MIRRALLIVAIVLLAPLLLSRCPAPPDKAKGVRSGGGFANALEDMIARQMRKTETVGLSLALLSDDELIYAQGFGYADRQKQVRARAETIYHVGSLSKSVTAALVLRLVEAGSVELEHHLGAYLPEFAIGATTEPPLFGPSRNPWNPERTTGGSSRCGRARAVTMATQQMT